VVFVGSGILARTLALVQIPDAHGNSISLSRSLYEGIFLPLAGPENGSFLYALTSVVFWLGILWILYARRLFIKI